MLIFIIAVTLISLILIGGMCRIVINLNEKVDELLKEVKRIGNFYE